MMSKQRPDEKKNLNLNRLREACELESPTDL